tara:strand:- start:807 stop:1214 length:408 start_codon:yes stop_codon:yes gene_type:complete
MSKPIELMRECNQILMRLHDVNKQQLVYLRQGEFNKLDIFTDKRQAILEMLDIVEEQLDRRLNELTEDEKPAMSREISLRKEVLQSILNQEMDLHKLVEQEKSKTILELQGSKKHRKAVSAYKSGVGKNKDLKEV